MSEKQIDSQLMLQFFEKNHKNYWEKTATKKKLEGISEISQIFQTSKCQNETKI